MSNSTWKTWEKDVATALGGKRRFRTMGSFSTETDDIRWPRKMREKYPILRRVKVECKKRRELDIPALFADATLKYSEDGRNRIILATKRPVGGFGKKSEALKERIEYRYRINGPVHKRRLKQLKQLKKQLKHKKGSKQELVEKKIRKVKFRIRHLKKDMRKQIKWETRLLRVKMSNTGLVTVTLEYFAELFKAWKKTRSACSP